MHTSDLYTTKYVVTINLFKNQNLLVFTKTIFIFAPLSVCYSFKVLRQLCCWLFCSTIASVPAVYTNQTMVQWPTTQYYIAIKDSTSTSIMYAIPYIYMRGCSVVMHSCTCIAIQLFVSNQLLFSMQWKTNNQSHMDRKIYVFAHLGHFF